MAQVIITLSFALSFGFIWTITLVYPPLHKILRKEKVFIFLIILSLVIPLINFICYNESLPDNIKSLILWSFQLFIFLVEYKYFDNYMLKKYNRHLYFNVMYNSFWQDEESDKVICIEDLFWFLLISVPLAISFCLVWLFVG